MTLFSRFCVLSCLALTLSGSASAEEPLHKRIDRAIEAKPGFSEVVSKQANDEESLRRVYLDLTGTIPTSTEAKAFFADASPSKRRTLIERLLASPEHARHLAHTFDVMLMERIVGKHVPQSQWHEYLRKAMAENKPWNELVREILSNDGSDAKSRAPAKFLLARNGDAHLLTRDISRLLLGKNFECAQCHDHPIVLEYHQADYFGLYAFLERSSVVTDKKKKLAMFSEKADGETTYQNVFDTKKTTKKTFPRILDLPVVKDPKVEKGKEYITKPGKGVAGVPRYSRRSQLAGQLVDEANVSFRRNLANRLWAMMMGRGLVHPLDFDHDNNPPSHPELLEMLADHLAANNYDIRDFLRELALTKTYQRSSELPVHVKEADPSLFATAILKPLSGEQFAYSLLQATGRTDIFRKSLGAKLTEPALYAKLAPQTTTIISAFGGEAGEPANFNATVEQALFLANGPLLQGWIKPTSVNLAARLGTMSDAKAVTDELFLSILTRLPSEAEHQEITAYLDERKDDRTVALEEVIWALVTSTEFRFNH